MKKITKIAALLATSIVSAGSLADALYNDGSTYQGAMPVAVVASTALVGALQTAQNLTDSAGAACTAADTSIGCMPQISSLEMASILSADASMNWAALGVAGLTEADHLANQTALPSSEFWEFGAAGVYVCGDPRVDDADATFKGATKVAAAHVGMGCSNGAASPDRINSAYADNAFDDQTTVSGCMETNAYSLNKNGWAGIGFVGLGDGAPANTGFLKMDGSAPTISEFMAGNYSMFGDVHAATAPGGSGFVAASATTPKHNVLGGSLSSLCVGGTASAPSMAQ